jgi:hypothetical protein
LLHLLLTIVLFLWDTTLAGEVDPSMVRQLISAVLRTLIIVPYFLFSKAAQGVFVVDVPGRKTLVWSEA